MRANIPRISTSGITNNLGVNRVDGDGRCDMRVGVYFKFRCKIATIGSINASVTSPGLDRWRERAHILLLHGGIGAGAGGLDGNRWALRLSHRFKLSITEAVSGTTGFEHKYSIACRHRDRKRGR
jgi:hypothetical protein